MAGRPLIHPSAHGWAARKADFRERLAPVLEVAVHVRPWATPVVVVRGELDLAGVEVFEDLVLEMIDRHGPDVVIDVSGLVFCDARGLGALVRCANRADRSGGRLTLVRPGSRLRRVIRLMGLDRLL
jgi:anti-anti-sigma factor